MCADLGGKKVKILWWFIGVTVSLLVGVGAYLVFFSGDEVKAAIETYAPPAEENIKGAVSDELVDRLKSITGKIGRAE